MQNFNSLYPLISSKNPLKENACEVLSPCANEGNFFVLKNQLTGLSSEEGPSQPGPWTQTSQSGVGVLGMGVLRRLP